MLTEIRIYLSVAMEQAHETLHRIRLRHSRTYRVNWVHTMRDFKAECRHNDALARALMESVYPDAYRTR